MKYTNSVCDGCGLPLREDDDIVVCPECGTPQHRECYKKENCCVNKHRHGEDFEWKSDSAPAPIQAHTESKTEEEMLPCPSCGHMNPKDAKRCESCSMKLIIFGMNLAENPGGQNPYRRDSEDLPDYDSPFTIGQGEGFDNTEEKSAPEQIPFEAEEYTPTENLPYGEKGFAPSQETPRSEESTHSRENARQFLLFRFIGANVAKFMGAFRKIDSGRGFTFNWAAFFFGPYWFFYRKLYKPGIIFLTVSSLISIIFTPTLNQFVTVTESYRSYGEALYTDEALVNAFISEIMPFYPIIIAFFVANIAVSLLSGLIAYPLYKKYAESSINRVMSAPSSEIGLSLVAKLGGTSFISPIAAYFVIDLMLSFVSGIMYGG